jgi:hypothetical protein
MNVIKSIQSDVKSADINRDGRVDFEDLKELFRSSYSHIYTADEIDEIGELFFVGKSGQPVKTTHLVRGICHIAQAAASQLDNDNGSGRPNPLRLQNLQDRRKLLVRNNYVKRLTRLYVLVQCVVRKRDVQRKSYS